MLKAVFLIFLLSSFNCTQIREPAQILSYSDVQPSAGVISSIGEIPPPGGFFRNEYETRSFPSWLRNLKLKKDKTVFLFNGQKKPNQSAQYAVIDLSRSKTDLQQCADVVMRLRAEYLFDEKKYDSIRFMDYSGKWYNWSGNNRKDFDNYLQQVFGWCGSASLEKQLKPVKNYTDIMVGDVLVAGGFPGHAMIVADMAMNNKGEKAFLLIQGYQPAQDMHVVINPSDPNSSPWYFIPGGEQVLTPEWRFYKSQLKRW